MMLLSTHPIYYILHKPNLWCLRMANPEPLPQRATRISTRSRTGAGVMSRESGRERRHAHLRGAPKGDNSNPSLTTSFFQF